MLTNNDRCDKCRAPAYVRVGVGNTHLLFCSHDYDLHKDALCRYPVEDFRPQMLLTRPV